VQPGSISGLLLREGSRTRAELLNSELIMWSVTEFNIKNVYRLGWAWSC